MHQFIVSARIRELRDTYPNGKHLLDMASQLSQSDLEALARLWLSEGIPFAFKEVPALYEAIRAWLGAQLNVHPKGITLIGSGRLGSSLAPPPEDTGREFGGIQTWTGPWYPRNCLALAALILAHGRKHFITIRSIRVTLRRLSIGMTT